MNGERPPDAPSITLWLWVTALNLLGMLVLVWLAG